MHIAPRSVIAQSSKHFLRLAGDLVVDLAREALATRARFLAALAGGSTPNPLYRLLAAPPFSVALPWPHIQWFYGDERCVPPDDPRCNHRMVRENLLPPGRALAHTLRRIHGELGAEEAAREYNAQLRRAFPGDALPVFDLILLGLGGDGHTASLFPNRPHEGDWAIPVAAPDMEPRVDRVSLSLPVLNAARKVVFLVTGPAKAELVAAILAGDPLVADLPAARVRPAGGALWLLDPEAGALVAKGEGA